MHRGLRERVRGARGRAPSPFRGSHPVFQQSARLRSCQRFAPQTNLGLASEAGSTRSYLSLSALSRWHRRRTAAHDQLGTEHSPEDGARCSADFREQDVETFASHHIEIGGSSR
jgi:hypothetical protein